MWEQMTTRCQLSSSDWKRSRREGRRTHPEDVLDGFRGGKIEGLELHSTGDGAEGGVNGSALGQDERCGGTWTERAGRATHKLVELSLLLLARRRGQDGVELGGEAEDASKLDGVGHDSVGGQSEGPERGSGSEGGRTGC